MTIKSNKLCPRCGGPMTKAGFQWSGKNRRQLYRCARKTGCGHVTMTPVEGEVKL